MKRLALFFITILSLSHAVAQIAGDYRSNPTSGNNWATIANWQRFNGVSWVIATAAPTSTDGAIEIRSGHTITVAADVTADQITVNGTLTVSAGITLSAGSASSMLTVNSGGTVQNNSGTIGGTNSSNIFNAGSLYIHDSNNNSGGVVPTATWNVSSTVRMAFSDKKNYILNSPSWSQAFGNFEINITSTGNRTNNFEGLITTINGNLSIVKNAGMNSTIVWASSGAKATTIGGNFSMIDNTTLNLASGGSDTLKVKGNFNHTAGIITTTGSGHIKFIGTSVQTYSRTGNINGAVNFSIERGAIVDFGSSTITQTATPGTGAFILTGEMRLGIASGLNGILVNSGTKTFNANSTITYNGSGAQVMGALYPGSPASGINVTINNAAGVTTSSLTTPATTTTTIPGNLFLQSGNLNVSAGHTLLLSGTVSRTSGNITMSSAANLTINGNGALGVSPFPFSADPTFTNFTVNRSSGTITLGHNVTINGTITLTSGTLALSAYQLSLNGNVSVTGGLLSGTSSSALSIAASGTLSTINFESGGNILGNLDLSRSGVTLSFGGDFTIANTLNLTTGTLSAGISTITMQGTSWSVDGGSGGIFNPGSGLVIFDGTTTLPYSTSFNHIQLEASRSLTFPSAIVNISGDLSFNGTFVHSSGTILLSGGSTQTFNGGGQSYYNITVNKLGGAVSATGGINLENVLNITSATDFQSNGNLTLASTNDAPDATGSIASLSGGADVSGTVNAKRYISQEGRMYRYMSSPIAGTTIADWQNDFVITGTFAGASTNDPANGGLTTICDVAIKSTSPSLYYYDESTAGTIQNGWLAYPTTTNSASIQQGRGYAPFIRETCYRPVVVTVSGTINKGSIALPVSYTNSGSADDGWNLVGNPYPSAIRWDANGNGWTKGASLSTVVSVTDNAGGGFITLFEGETIAQGQAFWVKANGAANSLIIDENAKESTLGSSFYRVSSERNMLALQITKGTITDKAYYRVMEEASSEYENYDFPNQDNDLFDIGTFIGSSPMAVNSVKTFSCGEVIQVQTKDLTTGTYFLNVNREGVFEQYDVMLKDKYTGVTTNISETGGYEFSVTSITASKAFNRFEIQLTQPMINTSVSLTSSGNLICSDQSYQVSVVNPQTNVSYFATINDVVVSDTLIAEGSISLLNFSIDSEKLQNGENAIFFHAFNVCSSEQLIQTITVTKSQQLVATASSATICNSGAVILKADENPEVAWYHWYEGETSETVIATGNSYQTIELTQSKTYYVAAVNGLGCEGIRVPILVEVIQLSSPTISVSQNNVLQSSASDGNQWYFNNELIQDATSSSIVATQSGVYRVEVTKQTCKNSVSIVYSLFYANENSPIVTYPNPFSSATGIKIEVAANQLSGVRLLSANGAIIQELNMVQVGEGLWISSNDLKGLPSGLYNLYVSADTKTSTIKIVKFN